MLLFTVIALHPALASIRLMIDLVPMGLAIVLFTTAPVSETRTILWPATGAIIGFMGWVLPWVLTFTYLLYPFFGHLWHWFKVGLRVDLVPLLHFGYATNGVEDIFHHPPGFLLAQHPSPHMWCLMTSKQGCPNLHLEYMTTLLYGGYTPTKLWF